MISRNGFLWEKPRTVYWAETKVVMPITNIKMILENP